ncbi:type IV secretory system conjugative DNA transfer family protein [Azospirillum canadense]|uniref:type IV secretory system conjugative DNA transfer family protein n=1 Tax=Azospirillum canadense TaxID=403962 RepID=UPI0022265E17|nr:type IV secretory system conjugative DNA transfer family protein [Azospirillum canadense]MCW2240348.1 defect-in-organelle-trafficking protein DotC [Azospirillum canadense]
MPPTPAAKPRRRRVPTPVTLTCAALILLPACPAPSRAGSPDAAATAVSHNPFRAHDCEAESTAPNPGLPTRAAVAPPPTLDALRDAPPFRSEASEADAARLAAVKQAALSLGMRAGFNRGIYCHQKDLTRLADQLDRQYDFTKLLYDAGGGFYFEPGVVTEHANEITFAEGGTKAASSTSRVVLNAREQLVTRARHWTQYLVVDIEPLAPISPYNRPKSEDMSAWNAWVKDGWQRGLQQAADTMNALWSELDRDYIGMLNFRRLANEQRLQLPRIVVNNRGVTGNADEIRVNDTEIEIKRPSGLTTNPAKWRALPFAAPLPTPVPPPAAAPPSTPPGAGPTRLKP